MKTVDGCGLCPPVEHRTEWRYSDGYVFVCKCDSHPEKWMVVWRAHRSKDELADYQLGYMHGVWNALFPEKEHREPQSMPEHYHLHEA